MADGKQANKISRKNKQIKQANKTSERKKFIETYLEEHGKVAVIGLAEKELVGMYIEMYEDIKRMLADNDHATKNTRLPFRTRSAHIWRVFQWTKRLLDGNSFDVAIDEEAVLIAALFHDVGYALPLEDTQHAENSAVIFNRYASEKGYDSKKQAFISYLISNHSNKNLLDAEDTPMELIILMEADMLDETGALSIVWDCMTEGAQTEQSFIKTYNHIGAYSVRQMERNPMKTDKAKEFWAKKQALTREFHTQLAFDLAINDILG